MSIKMESKQRTPSVIARLMGLEELPPHQPVQKKQRVLSENYRRRVASIGARERRHSFRLSAEEKKEFKGVFEALEKLKREKDNLSVKDGTVNLTSSEVKKAFKSQKSVDANCCPVALQLLRSKEAHDALRVVDSKVDLSTEDSLITKRLRNLQGIPYHLQTGHIDVLKSSHASHLEKTDTCRKPGGGTNQGSAKMLQKLETGLLTDSHGELGLGNTYKFLRSRMKSENGASLPLTKIVVLKPNRGSNSYGDSHSIGEMHKEFLSPEKGDLYVEEKERKNGPNDMESVGLVSRFSRDIAGHAAHGKNNFSTEASKSGSRDTNTFAQESEVMPVSSPNSSYWRNHYKPSFYHLDKSYVARKAKKEIFERWKTTEKFQEVEVASRCRTLGEMLTMPEHESMSRSLDFRLGEQGISSCIGLHSDWFMRPLESANRLQNGSRKQNHNQKNGSKSRNSGSSCIKLENSYSVQDDCVLHAELKRKLEEKDPCEQISLVVKSSSCSDICPDSESSCTMQESWVIQEEQTSKHEQKDPSEQNCVVTESSEISVASANMVADMVADAETEFVDGYKEQDFESTDCTLLMKDDYSYQVPDASTQQDMLTGISKEDSVSSFCYCTDFESLMSSEEAYQPSPNSVLEPPFEKESSSGSECFQDVTTDLHGLQLQLELLKSESLEAYSEGAGLIVSSDDDSEEGSVSNSGGHEFMRTLSIKESRDFSYLVDVFTEAGFHGRNSDMGYETWVSPECPISPAVFEMMEKKYGEQMSWKRSERRLLFDRINLELVEILQPSIGMYWTKPLTTKLSFRKNLEAIEEELWMLLVHQQKQVNKDSSVKVLGKDDGWLELGDDIEVIVREIENSLIDRLAAEIVSVESF